MAVFFYLRCCSEICAYKPTQSYWWFKACFYIVGVSSLFQEPYSELRNLYSYWTTKSTRWTSCLVSVWTHSVAISYQWMVFFSKIWLLYFPNRTYSVIYYHLLSHWMDKNFTLLFKLTFIFHLKLSDCSFKATPSTDSFCLL